MIIKQNLKINIYFLTLFLLLVSLVNAQPEIIDYKEISNFQYYANKVIPQPLVVTGGNLADNFLSKGQCLDPFKITLREDLGNSNDYRIQMRMFLKNPLREIYNSYITIPASYPKFHYKGNAWEVTLNNICGNLIESKVCTDATTQAYVDTILITFDHESYIDNQWLKEGGLYEANFNYACNAQSQCTQPYICPSGYACNPNGYYCTNTGKISKISQDTSCLRILTTSSCSSDKICSNGNCITKPNACTPVSETCDNVDNDCDNQVDEGCNINPSPLPIPPPPDTGGYDYKWWLVGLIAVIVLIFTGIGKKLLGLVGVGIR